MTGSRIVELTSGGRSTAVFSLPQSGLSSCLEHLPVTSPRYYGESVPSDLIIDELHSLGPETPATVVIDAYGRRLQDSDGEDLDAQLFLTIFGSDLAPEIARTCVLGLRSVDPHDLTTSHVVERCVKVGYSMGPAQATDELVAAGCVEDSASDLAERFGGWIGPLMAGVEGDALVEATVFDSASGLLPEAVGCLTPQLQLRLAQLANRENGAPSTGDDEFLQPLVRVADGRAQLSPWLARTDLTTLVLGGMPAWPQHAPVASARRFRSRIGPEPTPRWVDPFLGSWIEELPGFLETATSSPSCHAIELLSGEDAIRNIPRRKLARALQQLGSLSSGASVEWRIAADRHVIHERQLHLPHLARAWRVPPFDRLCGRYAVGNEVDAPLGSIPWSAVERSWQTASSVANWV